MCRAQNINQHELDKGWAEGRQKYTHTQIYYAWWPKANDALTWSLPVFRSNLSKSIQSRLFALSPSC